MLFAVWKMFYSHLSLFWNRESSFRFLWYVMFSKCFLPVLLKCFPTCLYPSYMTAWNCASARLNFCHRANFTRFWHDNYVHIFYSGQFFFFCSIALLTWTIWDSLHFLIYYVLVISQFFVYLVSFVTLGIYLYLLLSFWIISQIAQGNFWFQIYAFKCLHPLFFAYWHA